MPTAVQTSVTELGESRVRVTAQVPADEVERRVQQKARELGRDMRVPGFRKGKLPAPLVIQRIGRDAVLDEAIRDGLANWYVDAIDAAGIAPVGDPKVELGDPPAEGEALTFSIEIGVRPVAQLGAYRGLEVGRREPAADERELDASVEAMRERLAKLETSTSAAAMGDFVVIDYVGSIDGVPFAGGEGRDQLAELGARRLIPGFEEGLVGVTAGEQRTIELTFPDDYGATELAGRPASFAVTVKEVKHKELPPLDDDFAADVGFDTVAELREDVRARLLERDELRIEDEFREAALDAAVAAAKIDVPAALVTARAGEMWDRAMHSLSHQGINTEVYLKATGRTQEEVIAEAEPEAERALRREAVIAAIVTAEGISPSEEELSEALAEAAERDGHTPQELLADLRRQGRVDELRADLASRRALDLIAAEAVAIPAAAAAAREKLWTPDSEGPPAAAGGRLWTPDQ